jgi:BirA family biotin operon repressor/biotin-[acetyl-CoA-carboxylase] ligase
VGLERGPAIARLERFGRLPSTQDVVRRWLDDGQAEICLATADEQTAGRGRLARSWVAAPGRALLVSAGFRPAGLALPLAWRLPAVVALAALETTAALLGEAAGRLALKWPNDLVAVEEGELRKVGGVLAEVRPDGDRLDSAVVGLGLNVDWPAVEFPGDLSAGMSSLRELAGRPVDREQFLSAWLERLLASYGALLAGRFDAARWAAAQATTGALVTIQAGDRRLEGRAVGVDPLTGDLLVAEGSSDGVVRVSVGEVVGCRVRGPARGL